MSWRQAVLVLAVTSVFPFQTAAYDPGDVNGDGTADAADVVCTMATVFDAAYGCAVATQSPMRHVVRVSATGGDYTSIQEALNDITASSGDGWLIQVGPGVYNERVTMEEWVDIEGSGEGVTVISFTGSANPDTGTIVGADSAELRHVTVQNTGGASSWAIGVYTNGTRPRLKQVRIEASGATNNAGIYCNGECPRTFAVNSWGGGGGSGYSAAFGLYCDVDGSTETDIAHVELEGEGGTEAFALYCIDASVHLVDAKLVAYASDQTLGVLGVDSVVTAQRSMIVAENGDTALGLAMQESTGQSAATIVNSEILASSDAGGASVHPIWTDATSTVVVGGSLVMGGTVSSAGATCAGVYDENGTFYASSCP